MTLELRPLDPVTDIDLYREAYQWRLRPKKHAQPDRMPFETFTANDPAQIAIGLFNGEFLAVFFFHEFEPQCFESHFTSRRNVSKETLLEGAKEIVKCFMENGAKELTAWITPRNRPLQSFVEALGFTRQESKLFPKRNSKNSDTLPEMREFVKYGLCR